MAPSDRFPLSSLYAQRGIIFAFLGAALFAFNSLMVNVITERISPTIVIFACLFAYLPSVAFIRWDYGERYRGTDAILIILVGLSGLGVLVLGVIAFSMPQIGSTSAIVFSRPVICVVLGKVLLDEPFGISDVVLVFLNFVGVILISEPPFLFGGDSVGYEGGIGGLLVAVACAVCGASQFIASRKLVQRDTYDPALLLLTTGITGMSAMPVIMLVDDVDVQYVPTATDWGLLVLAVVVCGFSFACTYLALHSEKASVVSLIATTEVVISYFFQAFLTDDPVGWVSIAGACLIITAPLKYAISGIFREEPSHPEEEQ